MIQVVAIDQPESAAASLASKVPGLTVDQVLASPFALLADSAPAAAAELHRRQDAFGINSWTTHEANLDVFGDVIAAYQAA